MSITPRTDFIAHKGYTERAYICEMTELARILETELYAMQSEFGKMVLSAAVMDDQNVELRRRAEKAENKLAASKAEIENLIWNLAGCSTIAHSGKPTDYSHELARPALHDVNRLAARAEKAEAELISMKSELKKAEKKNYREEVKTYNDLQARIANQVERIRHLESLALARAEKLEADTKRLDWLSSQERIDYCKNYWLKSHLGQHPNRTLRAAIDAAMKETNK